MVAQENFLIFDRPYLTQDKDMYIGKFVLKTYHLLMFGENIKEEHRRKYKKDTFGDTHIRVAMNGNFKDLVISTLLIEKTVGAVPWSINIIKK